MSSAGAASPRVRDCGHAPEARNVNKPDCNASDVYAPSLDVAMRRQKSICCRYERRFVDEICIHKSSTPTRMRGSRRSNALA